MEPNPLTTGLAYDPRCLGHDNGSMVVDERARDWIEVAHAENPERLRRAREVLVRSGVLARLATIEARLADEAELALVHGRSHIKAVRESCRAPISRIGPEARAGAGSWDAALLSAGCSLAAVDFAMARVNGRAYSLARPPGHHASADQAMGFCLFNNAALAARHAQRVHGLERVAIVDWDVHHGNGTQDVFYEDPDVLFISLHQDGLYPADLGSVGERGRGRGLGANINIPMPAGSGDPGYVAALEQIVIPSLESFGPDLIVLSSGQDAAASDPLGRMSVTTEGFRSMTSKLVEFARHACEGRVIALQEGGYSLDHMPFAVLATVEALAGLEPALKSDPIELDVPVRISPAETEAIRLAREASKAD